jgi:beta-glucosidase
VQAVAAANPNTVVVLKSGSAVLMPWVDAAPAILEAWYPGEEDGNAVAAVLFGDFNPSGKLPITFPRNLEDLPANTPEQYPGVNGAAHYSEGVFVGYRHYDSQNIDPLFAFGHGLSYTSFSYDNLEITGRSKDDPRFVVELDVSNAGNLSGGEAVQLYVGMPSTDDLPQPPEQLKGFEKVHLDPGETTHVQFVLDARSFSHWDTASHAWAITSGTYQILVGSSSRDIRLEGQVAVDSPLSLTAGTSPQPRRWRRAPKSGLRPRGYRD